MEGLLEGSKGKLEEFVESLETEADECARMKARLQALHEILADTDCTTTHELLACAEDTRSLLADWDRVAGASSGAQCGYRASRANAAESTDCSRLQRCRPAMHDHDGVKGSEPHHLVEN